MKQYSPEKAREKLAKMFTGSKMNLEITAVSNRPDSFMDDMPKGSTHYFFKLSTYLGTELRKGYYSVGPGINMPKDFATFKKLAGFWVNVDMKHVFDMRNTPNKVCSNDQSLYSRIYDAVRVNYRPDQIDIVCSLLMDATNESFECWCYECGWNTDSRKAEKMWNTCRGSEWVMRLIFRDKFDAAKELAHMM